MAGKGVKTRCNIVSKAMQLFSIKGYYHTGINDILSATGLTKGGLYGHFRSKEDIWYAVYDQAVVTWRTIVFKDIRDVVDPLERIEKVVSRHLDAYLANDVFEGGCFFVNMLVELSGQSTSMSRHLLSGFVRFARLIQSWLDEAADSGMLKNGLDTRATANYILISLNGAATLYAATRDRTVLRMTGGQIDFYLQQLKTS